MCGIDGRSVWRGYNPQSAIAEAVMSTHLFSRETIERARVPEVVITPVSTRRQIISGCAVALGSLAMLPVTGVEADAQQRKDAEESSDKSIALHQEVDFKAAPQ